MGVLELRSAKKTMFKFWGCRPKHPYHWPRRAPPPPPSPHPLPYPQIYTVCYKYGTLDWIGLQARPLIVSGAVTYAVKPGPPPVMQPFQLSFNGYTMSTADQWALHTGDCGGAVGTAVTAPSPTLLYP